METDSDSDRSHISTTPPRDSKPSTPPSHSKPSEASLVALVSSYKSRVRSSSSSSSSRLNSISNPKSKSNHKPLKSKTKTNIKSKPKPKIDTKTKPTEENSPTNPIPFQVPQPISNPKSNSDHKRLKSKSKLSEENSIPNPLPSPEFSNLSGLSVRFRGPSDLINQNVSVSNSIENLPANFCSKTAFFSKIRREYSIPDPTEEDKVLPAEPTTPQPEVGSCDGVEGAENSVDSVTVEANRESFSGGDSVKLVKRLPDVIGGNLPSQPQQKRPKSVNEGNFVRLNINGYGRSKFKNKCGKRRYSSYSSQNRRSSWRGKSKFKAGGTGEDEAEGLLDEDGLVSETARLQKERESSKCGNELVEQAVLDARNDPSDENLLKLMKLSHGYDSFREGQLEAIKQVLAAKSTMLVLPTGAGKSLCYQLAALVLEGLVLVVSPLVALMIDQLRQLPPMIPGGLLCSSQIKGEASETVRLLVEGKIKVLFVSPERFLSADFLSIIGAQPLISLVVVDEAHCLSEWSHNFRPSYLRLRASILHTKLNVKCFLAMTATATTKTLQSVMIALDIPATNLIQTSQIRKNLQLSVTLSENRMKDLMLLMKSSPFTEVKSIIIYCKFQFETDLLSKYLRDNNINAKSYHSGIPAKDRSRTQEMFCCNKIKVVVATVAFGMGLDKSDVGAVIHYSLPESLEEYVQEIGRAGRDGRESYCHLIYDDAIYFKLRSLSYSDGVDEYAVNRFLSQVFSNDSSGKMCSLVKESASRKFDMKEEVINTILTYLELEEVQYLRLLPPMSATCTLYFHKTSPALLARKDIVVAEILKKSETKQGPFVFDIPSVANSIGIAATDLLNQLQNLKFKGEITYEMKDPAYCYIIMKSPADLCSLASKLTSWLSEVEICKVRKLDAMFDAVKFAANVCEKKDGCSGTLHTQCLQRRISDYFNKKDNDSSCDIETMMGQGSRFLRADIKVFLQSNSHAKFTPRAIARIMHGIPSPAYPCTIWSKTHFWGRYTQIDFPVVMEAAKAELMSFAGKDVL